MGDSRFLYLVPVDGYPSTALAPMQRAVSWGLALADGLPNLNGGLPPPADGLPLATDSKDINLAAAAAALASFRIGLCRNC